MPRAPFNAVFRGCWPLVGFVCLGCGARSGLSLPAPLDGCAALGSPTLSRELYLLVDRSTSMNCPIGPAGNDCGLLDSGTYPPQTPAEPSRWSTIKAALDKFLSAPESAGNTAGLGFFPVTAIGATDACEDATYALPDVPFSALPAAAPAFDAVLGASIPAGGTPTVPALNGAIDFVQQRELANPQRQAAVVLLTDGIPTFCDTDTAAVVAAAERGRRGTPSVLTFVVGVGPELDALDAVAAAGGTAAAHLVDTTLDWSADVAQTLAALPSQCEP
jgi:hypothetical protein